MEQKDIIILALNLVAYQHLFENMPRNEQLKLSILSDSMFKKFAELDGWMEDAFDKNDELIQAAAVEYCKRLLGEMHAILEKSFPQASIEQQDATE